jgi:hypothetical protein
MVQQEMTGRMELVEEMLAVARAAREAAQVKTKVTRVLQNRSSMMIQKTFRYLHHT